MLQSEVDTRSLWARLPEADPPAGLREAVLEDWRLAHGGRSGRFATGVAGLAVAALFVLAVSLSLRMQAPPAVDPAVALLRAQGLEVSAPPTDAKPVEVRRVVSGSTAARVGLRAGDQLLAIVSPLSEGGMVNLAVMRGSAPQYFALPAIATRASEPGAGMADASRDQPAALPVAIATPAPGDTSLLQTAA